MIFFKGGVCHESVCEFAGTEENVTKHVEVAKAKSKKSKKQKAGDKSWTLQKLDASKARCFKSWRQKLDALKAGA